ncbi:MAG TPA: Gfo/Idh/MocA family oxidoreductase [Candidatus Cloacimonadota bacterium]|nr:Gfo/Idh/MocA family oxidoreductase [Candidatus Cloacimonadota bacterium]
MVKIGVVGVGHLGKFHVQKFLKIADCILTGIYDINQQRAQEVSQALGVKSFPTYEELLDNVDAVDIAATTTYHYELAKSALLKGKHIFVEKPITSDLAQAEELLQIAKDKDMIIQVGHIERFNPVILKVEDEINEPMFIESHRISMFQPRGTDVPVVLDLMIHDIDLILSFIQSPLQEIRASGVGILTPSIDIANARLEFANGAIANVTSSRVSMKQERKIRFFQQDAYISLDFIAKQVTVMKKAEGIKDVLPDILLGKTDFKPEELIDIKNIDVRDYPKDALEMELESFITCVKEHKQPKVDGAAATRALQVAMDIVRVINANTVSYDSYLN